MPAGNKAGYGKYNDIMPRMRDPGGDNIRAMTGRPATMDEGQRQYMLNQGDYTGASMAGAEDPTAADQQPSRQMLMQGNPSDYISQNQADMMSQGQQDQGMQAYADMLGPADQGTYGDAMSGYGEFLNQRQQERASMAEAGDYNAADAETQNMMMQMQGIPQETDQRGAYLKALQDSLKGQ